MLRVQVADDDRCQPGAYVSWGRQLFEVLRFDDIHGRVVCQNCRTLGDVHVPIASLSDVKLVRAAPIVPDAVPA